MIELAILPGLAQAGATCISGGMPMITRRAAACAAMTALLFALGGGIAAAQSGGGVGGTSDRGPVTEAAKPSPARGAAQKKKSAKPVHSRSLSRRR